MPNANGTTSYLPGNPVRLADTVSVLFETTILPVGGYSHIGTVTAVKPTDYLNLTISSYATRPHPALRSRDGAMLNRAWPQPAVHRLPEHPVAKQARAAAEKTPARHKNPPPIPRNAGMQMFGCMAVQYPEFIAERNRSSMSASSSLSLRGLPLSW